MKISKSKQELARIISENCGWRDGAEWAAQDSKMDDYPLRVCLYKNKPKISKSDTRWIDGKFNAIVGDGIDADKQIPNWHQTVLSRAEYLHLYPVAETAPEPEPDAEVKLAELVAACEALGAVLSTAGIEPVVEAKQTIEQLAADYRNAKDYAERKQQEADAAKSDVDEKLRVLELAGEAHGLLVTPITTKQEPELVTTDWRDLRVGDVVELISFQGGSAKVGEIGKISKFFGNGDFHVDFPSQRGYSVDHSHIKFIRRP